MCALLKLYDKLLYKRIAHLFSAAESPWQGGGHGGADERAWLLCQVIEIIRMQQPKAKVYVCFMDGESAFCRPPPCFVLHGAAEASVDPQDLLALCDFLYSHSGTAILGHCLVGRWKVQ